MLNTSFIFIFGPGYAILASLIACLLFLGLKVLLELKVIYFRVITSLVNENWYENTLAQSIVDASVELM
jgi:hypothetical protein